MVIKCWQYTFSGVESAKTAVGSAQRVRAQAVLNSQNGCGSGITIRPCGNARDSEFQCWEASRMYLRAPKANFFRCRSGVLELIQWAVDDTDLWKVNVVVVEFRGGKRRLPSCRIAKSGNLETLNGSRLQTTNSNGSCCREGCRQGGRQMSTQK